MIAEIVCSKHGLTTHVKRPDGKFRCRKCCVVGVQKRRHLLKEQSIQYLGGSCSKCGYSKCMAALEFHHLDPTVKEFNIGTTGFTRSWARIKAELDKCILLCANCHRELHSNQEVM